jgi:hypothetical protein
MMTKQEEKDIKIVLDYLWQDEQKHYQENQSKNHVYSVLRRLAKRIGYPVAK